MRANLIKYFSTFAVAVETTAKVVTRTARINNIKQPQAILGGRKVDKSDPVMLTVANMEEEMKNINNMINEIDKKFTDMTTGIYK